MARLAQGAFLYEKEVRRGRVLLGRYWQHNGVIAHTNYGSATNEGGGEENPAAFVSFSSSVKQNRTRKTATLW